MHLVTHATVTGIVVLPLPLSVEQSAAATSTTGRLFILFQNFIEAVFAVVMEIAALCDYSR